jgi:hypothetical protein
VVSEPTPGGRPAAGPLPAFIVPLVLFALAGALWANPWHFVSPVPPATIVPAWATDISPVRKPKLSPEYKVAGYSYRCSDCHKLFPSSPEADASPFQHRDVVMRHGMNTRCFNCHHLTNRDAYVDDWGHEIPASTPQLLCGKCHGPVYRDWLSGAHGRTNGYWDKSRGPQVRCKCIECHDPHQPPFPPMPPAPPPSTLRMGRQEYPHETAAIKNPLHLSRSEGDAEGSDAPAPENGKP